MVRVIENQDLTQAGEDFLRVCCRSDARNGVFTTIERVLGKPCVAERTGGWRLRKLFNGLLRDEAAALQLATAYAQHKGIPVVFTQTPHRA